MTIYESLISLGFSPEEAESMMRTANLQVAREYAGKAGPRSLLSVDMITREAMRVLESDLKLVRRVNDVTHP